jgi:hypothetical protein
LAALAGAVGVADEGKDFSVVYQAVDHGRDNDVVGKQCALVLLVRRPSRRRLLAFAATVG